MLTRGCYSVNFAGVWTKRFFSYNHAHFLVFGSYGRRPWPVVMHHRRRHVQLRGHGRRPSGSRRALMSTPEVALAARCMTGNLSAPRRHLSQSTALAYTDNKLTQTPQRPPVTRYVGRRKNCRRLWLRRGSADRHSTRRLLPQTDRSVVPPECALWWHAAWNCRSVLAECVAQLRQRQSLSVSVNELTV